MSPEKPRPAVALRARPVLRARTRLVLVVLIATSVACGRQHELLPEVQGEACGISPSTIDFDTVTTGAQADRTFRITNSGDTRLAGTLTESCPDFLIVGSATYDLGSGEFADFTVRFTPGSAGAKSCTIETGGECPDVAVSGTGGEVGSPSCGVAPGSLDFGTIDVGQTADRTLVVTNTGSGRLAGTVAESCSEFSIVGSASYDLGGGESDTFTVRFAPVTSGAKTCTIDVGSLCSDVIASGTGAAVSLPSCGVAPGSLDFGTVDVGQTAERTLVVTNTGSGRLAGTVVESCSEFSIVGSASYDLGGGESDTFTVRFAPVTSGAKTCTIDVGSVCSDVIASGTGRIVTACQLSATSIDFGDVPLGQSGQDSLTVTNQGTSTLSGTLSESCPEFEVLGTPDYSLAPLQSATFTLRFTPSGTGDFQCTLQTGSVCGSVALSGAGEPPPLCQLSSTVLDFGTVKVGGRKDLDLFVTNAGGGELCGTPAESCDEFRLLNSAPYCVLAGATYKMKIRFEPSSAGSFECTVDPGAGCAPVTVRGVAQP